MAETALLVVIPVALLTVWTAVRHIRKSITTRAENLPPHH
jgi:uncharacterized membrane-anchored protein